MFLVVLNDSRSHFTLICWKVYEILITKRDAFTGVAVSTD